MYSVVYLARCSNLFHPSNILSMNSENLETGIRCPGDLHSHAEIQTQYHTIAFFFVETPSSREKTLILCFKRKTLVVPLKEASES